MFAIDQPTKRKIQKPLVMGLAVATFATSVLAGIVAGFDIEASFGLAAWVPWTVFTFCGGAALGSAVLWTFGYTE